MLAPLAEPVKPVRPPTGALLQARVNAGYVARPVISTAREDYAAPPPSEEPLDRTFFRALPSLEPGATCLISSRRHAGQRGAPRGGADPDVSAAQRQRNKPKKERLRLTLQPLRRPHWWTTTTVCNLVSQLTPARPSNLQAQAAVVVLATRLQEAVALLHRERSSVSQPKADECPHARWQGSRGSRWW